jgi:hypothetical protein
MEANTLFTELGFIWNDKHECWVSKKTYLGLGTGDDKKAHIYLDEDEGGGFMQIIMHVNRGDKYTLFDGVVKSESEIKQVMRMVQL